MAVHVLVVGELAQKVTDDIHFPFQLKIIQKYISFPQELSKPRTFLIPPSLPQCRKVPKIYRDGVRREEEV